MPEDGDGLIDAFLREAMPAPGSSQTVRKLPVQDYPAGRALLALAPAARAEAAAEVLERLALTARQDFATASEYAHRRILILLASRLLLGKLPAGEASLVRLAEAAGRFKRYYLRHAPVTSLVRIFAEHAEANGMGAPLVAALAPFAQEMRWVDGYEKQHALLAALRAGQQPWEEKAAPVQLQPGDAWANALTADLEALPAEARAAWTGLLTHCSTAIASAPARKWLDRAAVLVRAVGEESFVEIAARCLLQIGKPGTRPPVRRQYDEPTLIDQAQADLVRGLVWSCSTLADERLLAAVGAAGAACFQKLTYYGPRDIKVGNACLQTLSLTTGPSAVAWLARLRLKIKHPSARRQLDKALERVALREGMSPQELEEISVPTFDLDADGRRRETLGDFTAEVRIAANSAVELAWTRADGTPQKAVPAQVRAEHAAELADLKRTVKEIPAVLAAQRDRLERLCRSPREWSVAEWRERYLDQPLVGSVARRLIWWFRQERAEPENENDGRAGVWHAGRFVDAAGETFDPEPGSRVHLWHPLDATADEVASWRRRLAALAITQPFKQAHREIYRLTDAERETGTFSNRFAGQILKQHQFAALCAQRGWIYKLQGQWDSHNLPFLFLPEQGLRIDLWVEPHAEEEVSVHAIYLYVTTGRVSFTGEDGPCRLESVAPRVLSELMRDVDLFVSVCNAGNDPTWVDRERRREADYGGSGHVFGELGATAATRREVLAGLLPKLKIAGRCTLGDRFLTVRGGLRSYKIHLGSGNILMEPNDQYLCIVPTGSRGPAAFLPYEGDGMLDVILSKAFLLADDSKIADHTIVRQIRS